jgi:HEPN domain-containing protein
VWQFDGVTDYIKAARLRLADALELFEHPTSQVAQGGDRLPHEGVRHLRGALYLAGYAVECALKAYIIARDPPAKTFSGAMAGRVARGESALADWRDRTHDLLFLWRATDLEGKLDDADVALKTRWGTCRKWNWHPNWRYDPQPFTTRSRAAEVLRAVEAVYRWIDARRRDRE